MSDSDFSASDMSRLSVITTPSTKGAAIELQAEVGKVYLNAVVELLALDAANAIALRPTGAVVAFLFGKGSGDSLRTWLAQWAQRKGITPLVPIGTDELNIPPAPFEGLKSRNWSVRKHRPIILNRIGALLGLRIQHGATQVFVSYRAADGNDAATRIHDHLTQLGYRVFLDEADDKVSGEPNMPLGVAVQEKIDERLSKAHALLLLDTPRASESKWVHLEVEMAIGRMIPILPVVFKQSDSRSPCRFRQLQALHRQVPLPTITDGRLSDLTDEDLDLITQEFESYLSAVYQRRTIGSRYIAQQFVMHQWQLGPCEAKPHLYEAQTSVANQGARLLTCCSYEDTVFTGTVKQFAKDASVLAASNRHYWQHLYFYAGDPLFDENEKRVFSEEIPQLRDANIKLLHYEEAVVHIAKLTEALNVFARSSAVR